MRKLSTIQKRENLNSVYAIDEPGNGGAHHIYSVLRNDKEASEAPLTAIFMQNGARGEEGSTPGLLDSDLLEIARDRLKSFQSGAFATRENAVALTHIEEALMWMNRRVEDRIERNVLGTTKV